MKKFLALAAAFFVSVAAVFAGDTEISFDDFYGSDWIAGNWELRVDARQGYQSLSMGIDLLITGNTEESPCQMTLRSAVVTGVQDMDYLNDNIGESQLLNLEYFVELLKELMSELGMISNIKIILSDSKDCVSIKSIGGYYDGSPFEFNITLNRMANNKPF